MNTTELYLKLHAINVLEREGKKWEANMVALELNRELDSTLTNFQCWRDDDSETWSLGDKLWKGES